MVTVAATSPEPREPVGDDAAAAAEQAAIDATFAAMVAGWEPEAGRRPSAGALQTDPDGTPRAQPRRIEPTPDPAAAGGSPVDPVEPAAPEHATERPTAPETGDDGAHTAAPEDEGHFEPPEPPALPRPSAPAAAAMLVIAAGIALLIAPALVGLTDGVGFPLGLVAIAAGLGWLLSRLRAGPGPDDGWDDGARL